MATTSWVPGATGSGYDTDHLPYGVFSTSSDPSPRVGVRVGDHVADLSAAARDGRPQWSDLLGAPALNPLLAAGPDVWAAVRAWARDLLTDPAQRGHVELTPVADAIMRLPFEVADYVDFYASLDHATNVGRILRPDSEPLKENWRHLPVGYHGRAGSVVVSGTVIHRPRGQRRDPGAAGPVVGPSVRLDIEAELGFVVGRAVPLGRSVPTAEYERTVFGVVGVNDWSARDIQAWEYVPLGPNLGKSFATSVSAWVTPLAALEGARVPLPPQEPAVSDYLRQDGAYGYDIAVEVEIGGQVVARPNYRTMYWSPAQMLAHMTVNGASLRVGDLYASGTISGPQRHERGSLLELSWGGAEPFEVAGQPRTFLLDGDEVVLRYSAPSTGGGTLALGEVRGRVLPAHDPAGG
ncbi:fumarylacetoacetase [Jatrophihabitans fulvus]